MSCIDPVLGNSILQRWQQCNTGHVAKRVMSLLPFVSHNHNFRFCRHTLQIVLRHVARVAYCDAFNFLLFVLSHFPCSTICSKISEKASKLSYAHECIFTIAHPLSGHLFIFVLGVASPSFFPIWDVFHSFSKGRPAKLTNMTPGILRALQW